MALAELAPDPEEHTTSTVISDTMVRRIHMSLSRTAGLSERIIPDWVVSVRQQVISLYSLKEGWDGFGAPPIRRDALSFMANLLESVMQSRTPAPHIAPMSHEGVQLEWHQSGIDLEIEIESPGDVWVSYEIDGNKSDWELTVDFRSLSDPIAELTRRESSAG